MNLESLIDQNKLPIEHPEYCYPESINKYAQLISDSGGQIISGNDVETFRGRFAKEFASLTTSETPKIMLEIGCNAGHVLVEKAKQNPDVLFLGLDWKYKAIFRAHEKAQKNNVKNIVWLRAHALRLPFMFSENELNHIFLFFPDPWPKRSDWKNRFLSEKRLNQLYPILSDKAKIEIKTDHAVYFGWMQAAVEACRKSFRVVHLSYDRHAEIENPMKLDFPEVTVFEKLALKKGIPIHEMWLEKNLRTSPPGQLLH